MNNTYVLLLTISFLLGCTVIGFGQNKTITGTVTDKSTGETLPGVNILVKGTSTGASTDADGQYVLEVKSLQDTLVVSFVGYKTQEVPIDGRNQINITLQSQAITGEEMVVVGYGEQKKVDLTGSVSTIQEKDLENKPVSNMADALQGVSPNLNITNSGLGGEPGSKKNVNIRGIGSLTGNNSPYVLVDGVPMDLNDIDPSDVKSISVLKGASASAIYGSRAPYGVILVETKKGEGVEGVKFGYSNNISFSSPMGLPHLANSLKFVTAYNEASKNAGLGKEFTDKNIDRIKKYMDGEITEETWKLPNENDWAGNGIWNIKGNGNNDWLTDIYFKNLVMRQKHNLSVRGGGDNNSYYLSAGLWNQPGELNFAEQKYKRYNITANFSSEVTNWLTTAVNFKYIREDFQHFNTQQGWDRATMYHNFYRTNAFRPLKLPNGDYSQISDIPMLQGGKERADQNNYNIALKLKFEPIKNWTTDLLYNYKNITGDTDDNHKTVSGRYPNGEIYDIAYPISSFSSTMSNQNYQLFHVVTHYKKSLRNHNFKVLGGVEAELNQFNSLYGQRNNIVTSQVPSLSTSTGETNLDDNKSHWSTMGIFGRFNYNFKETYLLEVNGRYDGSSKFAPSHRWGFFPSASIGYRISNANFWDSVKPYINNFKIRASWGSLGNQNVSNSLYFSTVGIHTKLGWLMGDERPNYTTPAGLVRNDLTWETASTIDFGLDASFLDGRLSAIFDWYKRTTKDMFGPAEALPTTLGASPPKANNATLETRGFELELSWQDEINSDLSYNFKVSLADNISEVTEYNNPTRTLSTWYEGQTIGDIWGYQTAGIYQTEEGVKEGPDQSLFYPTWGLGDIHYKDIDGDEKITRGEGTADEPGDMSVIGNNQPRYHIGVTGGFQWKGFDFRMFWQGVLKRDYSFLQDDQRFYGFHANQWWDMNVYKQTTDYWRPGDEDNMLGPNTDAYYPKPYLSLEDYKNKQIQTRYTQNAAYLRLKNVTLGYTIPTRILSKVKVSRARIYITGENLLTVTPLTDLIDPEALVNAGWGVGKIHPLRRTYAVGINVSF